MSLSYSKATNTAKSYFNKSTHTFRICRTFKKQRKYLSFLFFLIFFSSLVFKKTEAQKMEKPSHAFVFYKSQRGPAWTRQQLDSFLFSKNNNRYKLISRIIGTEQRGDTLFYKINIIMDPAPVDANNELLAGQQLPAFQLHDVKGNNISTTDLKGKPLVINFWFTSCVPCIQEMPALNEIKEKYKNTDVVFLAITFDKKASVENFLKRHSFDFIPVPDAAIYCSKMTVIYPLTLFVDRNGIIRFADHYMPSYDLSNTHGRNFDTSGFEKYIDEIK